MRSGFSADKPFEPRPGSPATAPSEACASSDPANDVRHRRATPSAPFATQHQNGSSALWTARGSGEPSERDRQLGGRPHRQLAERVPEVVGEPWIEPQTRGDACGERHDHGGRAHRDVALHVDHHLVGTCVTDRIRCPRRTSGNEPAIASGSDWLPRVIRRYVAAGAANASGSADDAQGHLSQVDRVRPLQAHPHRVATGAGRVQRVDERAQRQAGALVRGERGERRVGGREERVLFLQARGAGPARLPPAIVDPRLRQRQVEPFRPRLDLGVARA